MDDDTWFKEEYKTELIGRLPSGRKIYSVKTPEDFAAEVAAKKAKMDAAKEKKEIAAAEKAVAKAAKAEETLSRIQLPLCPPHNGRQDNP
jgi:hypothetical protein